MANLFKFYNQNKKYFKLTEQGHIQDSLFPIHKEILNKCRKRRGLIVDLGCGTGLDLLSMTSKNNFCLGIDISQLAIKKALKRTKNKKNIDFKCSNLENLPLENNSVNVITLFFVFEHLLNSEKVLDEIDRVLKLGEEVFILCPNYSSPFRNPPIFGGIRKVRIVKKMILSLWRIFNVWFLRAKNFKVRRIEPDLTKTGEDWDAVNEPSVFEFINYFKRKNYKIVYQTWLSPPKTKIENFFSYFKNFPIIRYWGPICYIHVKKQKEY